MHRVGRGLLEVAEGGVGFNKGMVLLLSTRLPEISNILAILKNMQKYM